MDIDKIIQKAAMIATREAMNGTPLQQLFWIPPQSGTDDPDGHWGLIQYTSDSPSSKPPWE